MSKAEKTRQLIIEQTAPLFNKKGYVGTSLLDITEATGLTKGSIYGNFESKNEVAIAAYQYNANTLRKKIAEAIASKHSATEKLIAFTQFYRANWKNLSTKGGCPLLNAAVEADDNLPFLKKTVQDSFAAWADSLRVTIETGERDKEFKDGINALEYANTFIILVEGGILLSKITDNPHHLYTALNRVIFIIDNELKR